MGLRGESERAGGGAPSGGVYPDPSRSFRASPPAATKGPGSPTVPRVDNFTLPNPLFTLLNVTFRYLSPCGGRGRPHTRQLSVWRLARIPPNSGVKGRFRALLVGLRSIVLLENGPGHSQGAGGESPTGSHRKFIMPRVGFAPGNARAPPPPPQWAGEERREPDGVGATRRDRAPTTVHLPGDKPGERNRVRHTGLLHPEPWFSSANPGEHRLMGRCYAIKPGHILWRIAINPLFHQGFALSFRHC